MSPSIPPQLPGSPPPLSFRQPRSTDRLAIASLILGLLGLLAGVPALIAIVLGHISRSRIRKQPHRLVGSGLALTGLITGYVALVFWALVLGCMAMFPVMKQALETASKESAARSRVTIVQKAQKNTRTRQAFKTHLLRKTRENEAADPPDPATGMKLVSYPGPLGDMAAYVSIDPADGKKHPAIIWLIGGFSNSISADVLPKGDDPENDQSASAFREAGLLMLYPSLRGGNKNPGFKEGLLGEVDDVLAALAWLKQQPYIDPSRIYLGGHSTGGTLALLVAGSTTDLRAVISFGAAYSTAAYGQDVLPFDVESETEAIPRAPILCLDAINAPTFVIEGVDGNIESLRRMRRSHSSPFIQYFEIPAADHFQVLRPLSELLAKSLLQDTGPTPNIVITAAMLHAAMKGKAP
jgi:alpha/beta superfamily hydrolase